MTTRLRILPALALLAAVAAFTGAVPAAAWDKHEPAPQWAVDAAKTPTPASAKDSPAVVLFDEYLITFDNDNHAIEREREAIRILKPQGRGYTHCSIGYDIDEKLNYFRSWTITPDGHQFQACLLYTSWNHRGSTALCRCLCRNPAIPASVGSSRAVSLRHTHKAVNVRETRMDTASRCRFVSLDSLPYQATRRFDTEEVAGSSPVVPTIFINNLDGKRTPFSSQIFAASAIPVHPQMV